MYIYIYIYTDICIIHVYGPYGAYHDSMPRRPTAPTCALPRSDRSRGPKTNIHKTTTNTIHMLDIFRCFSLFSFYF